MASTRVLKGRLVQKADTEANWEKATTFVPLKGEICVYLPDNSNTETRIKIGDGTTKVNSLEFVSAAEAITTAEIDEICGASIVAASEVEF